MNQSQPKLEFMNAGLLEAALCRFIGPKEQG